MYMALETTPYNALITYKDRRAFAFPSAVNSAELRNLKASPLYAVNPCNPLETLTNDPEFSDHIFSTAGQSASLTLNNERASSEGNCWTAFATAVVISGNAQEGAVLGTGWRSLDIPFDGDSRINGCFIG